MPFASAPGYSGTAPDDRQIDRLGSRPAESKAWEPTPRGASPGHRLPGITARLIVRSPLTVTGRSSHAHATRSLQEDAERRGAGRPVPDRTDLPGPDGPGGRAAHDGRVLVVIQLDGGNDAINTLVPFRDEGYAKHRNALRLDQKSLIKVNDQVGLHPALREMGKLLERGELALVPGVGYPNPNRSHFESMAIWQSARMDPEEHAGPGWIGRGLDARLEAGRAAGERPSALFIGDGTPPGRIAWPTRRDVGAGSDRRPRASRGMAIAPTSGRRFRRRPAMTLSAYVRRSVLDAYAASERVAELTRQRAEGDARYPGTALAGRLQTVARLLKADLGARVFYTVQGGYDTHAGQSNTHYSLLFELGGAVNAFLDDLAAAKLADRVVVLGFSEFGRRVAENSSSGTDHGTAGLVFLVGPGVKSGVHGKVPSLTDLVDGDPKITTDFRRVYAAVLERLAGLAQPAGARIGVRADGPVPG